MWRYGVLLLMVAATVSQANESPRGLWLTPRKDPRNQARADVAGKMTSAPWEVWRISTGGSVYFARQVAVDGEPAVLAQAGNNLMLTRWSGEVIWQQTRLGIGRVLRVDDFDGDGRQEVLAGANERSVLLLDVATGEVLWTWESAPSTQVSGVAFLPTGQGLRFICFPSYGDDGWCFDFSGSRVEQPARGPAVGRAATGGRCQPRLVWHQSYAGKYGVGYGPNIVLADMDGDGKLDIALSSKLPGVYQAIVDADSGQVKCDVHYMVEGLDWGRPYGLFQVCDLDNDGFPDLVMISCQVEEYLAVARNVGGRKLEHLWSKFIEKDWPTDTQELRPQVTSLADVNGDGRPELVVGLWDSKAWRTAVIDPLKGFESRRETEPGWYFWGCHDINGDGRAEVIVSRESRRRPSRVTTLAALDGQTLRPVAELPTAAVFASADSPLPPDRDFWAVRTNPIHARAADGTAGILVRRFTGGKDSGLYLWGAEAGQPVGLRPISGPGWLRAHLTGPEVLLGDPEGGVQALDAQLRPTGPRLALSGRGCVPLVWTSGGQRELVYDAAGGKVVGGVPDLRHSGRFRSRWQVPGSYPALHVDRAGHSRLCAADMADPDNYAALIYTGPVGSDSRPLRLPQDFPLFSAGAVLPFGDDFRVLASLQTGVHTFALACYDAGGGLLWRDTDAGAYPRTASAADLDGDGQCEVLADDHGVLKLHGPDGKTLATDPGWPPAYCTQIVGPFAPGGETLVLRANGINGVSLIDRAGKPQWKTTNPPWRYYRSLAAVGDVAGDGHLAQGILAEDGVFECLDVMGGKLRWTLPLRTLPNGSSVVAGDVDGDGRDEFLLGTSEGSLLCLGERDGRGQVIWRRRFPAGVMSPIIADVDGDGVAEIVLATSDGYLRILKERTRR